MPLTDCAEEILAFVTPDHFLHYTVIAVGLRNALSTFQRLVNRFIEGMHNVEAYLDDIQKLFTALFGQNI